MDITDNLYIDFDISEKNEKRKKEVIHKNVENVHCKDIYMCCKVYIYEKRKEACCMYSKRQTESKARKKNGCVVKKRREWMDLLLRLR